MLQRAQAWIGAWNRKDLDAVMEHFTDDATFTSPRALELTGSAVIRGRDGLRAYWRIAMQRVDKFEFRLDRALWDDEARELVVVYTSVRDGAARRACEIMRFDADGRQYAGEALYGAPA